MISDDMMRRIEAVKAKRPRTVLHHILQHGFITTDDLKSIYGYNHPPRAAMDVKDLGIPLEAFKVTGPDGRKIAAYRLQAGDQSTLERKTGRRALPKRLKNALYGSQSGRCGLCGGTFEPGALQIDHRVPYEVVGDSDEHLPNEDELMLVCGSCNRAKSWSCEACANWQGAKDRESCTRCMWASPEAYLHIAGQERRSLTLGWEGQETTAYDELVEEADERRQLLTDYVREILAARRRL